MLLSASLILSCSYDDTPCLWWSCCAGPAVRSGGGSQPEPSGALTWCRLHTGSGNSPVGSASVLPKPRAERRGRGDAQSVSRSGFRTVTAAVSLGGRAASAPGLSVASCLPPTL